MLGLDLDFSLDALNLLDADLVGVHLHHLDLADPWAVGCLMGGPATEAIATGTTDENILTDLEFNARHPERGGAKIQKSEKDLAKEWLAIRNGTVRPAVAAAASLRPGAALVPAGPAPAPAPGSNAAVAEEQADIEKKKLYVGAGLGAIAALSLLTFVATR